MTNYGHRRLRTASRRQAGLTLLELLVVMAMTAILAVAISFAFSMEVTMQRMQEARRTKGNATETMERTITHLLTGARLATGSTTGLQTAYFQGLSDGGPVAVGSDRITFTTTAPSIPMAAINSQDDFQTQQSARGPVGGLAEVSIGMTPIGSAGGQTGLFERIEQPSDTDPTQGGMEFDLDPDIASIGFEFWDGTQWEETWDTTTMTTPRLPEAVQVTYTLTGESNSVPHLFVIPIPSSDVTYQNPVTSGGTASATGAPG